MRLAFKIFLILIVGGVGFLLIPGNDCTDCKIKSVTIEDEPVQFPLFSDIWTSTLDSDGTLFFAFGDGTGMGTCLPTTPFGILTKQNTLVKPYQLGSDGCYDLSSSDLLDTIELKDYFCEFNDCNQCFKKTCDFTNAGIITMTGNLPHLNPCVGEDECVISRHVPYGDEKAFEHFDKVSSLMFDAGRLYAHVHYPPVSSEAGYIAYSEDRGRTWEVLPNSPWDGSSNFKTNIFVQLHDKDNFVYSLGIQYEGSTSFLSQQVYLNRVPEGLVSNYQTYEYFSGLEKGNPTWSKNESDAKPLEGLNTLIIGSAIYHKEIDRYLFLTGWDGINLEGSLYEAENLWGPWHKAGTFPAGYIANIIPKGVTADYFYFTGSDVFHNLGYNLNILKITLGYAP